MIGGRQPNTFCDARVWVLPNPSGLNGGFSIDVLVEAYTALRQSLRAELLPAGS